MHARSAPARGPRVVLEVGDITGADADAIVNAANSTLLGGGGVDGAIHAAAGPELLAACRALRETELPDGLAPGRAVATEAGELPARWVIHTVGPNRNAGQTDPAVLSSCYAESLREAQRIGARTLAFPAIGAGVFGWQPGESAAAAARALEGEEWEGIAEVRFVLFSPAVHAAFAEVFGQPAG